jgi:hypothetical protein
VPKETKKGITHLQRGDERNLSKKKVILRGKKKKKEEEKVIHN